MTVLIMYKLELSEISVAALPVMQKYRDPLEKVLCNTTINATIIK